MSALYEMTDKQKLIEGNILPFWKNLIAKHFIKKYKDTFVGDLLKDSKLI
jgi:myosin-crossreactive antigen